MAKVSIIVPIYNGEEFLDRSIRSLREQTLQDIEIILVNDGSLDNSLEICRKYEKIDDRIIVIDKCNEGVSKARNIGMKLASGEYITFIDVDDWVENEMYFNMYEHGKTTKSDVVMCNYIVDRNASSKHIKIPIEKECLNKEQIIDELIPQMIAANDLNTNASTIMGSVWRMVIKKELINKYHINFPMGIPIMEDLIFCIQVLMKSNKVYIDKGYYYHYINEENSTIRKYRANMYEIQKRVFEILSDLLEEEQVVEKMKQRMNIRYVKMHIDTMINEINSKSNKREMDKIRSINLLCKDTHLKKILYEIDIQNYNLRKKIILKSIKYEIGIFIYAYYSFFIRIMKW